MKMWVTHEGFPAFRFRFSNQYDQWYRALRLLAGGELAEYTDAKTARYFQGVGCGRSEGHSRRW